MPNVSYEFDPNGLNPANIVPEERFQITEANFRDFHFVIPTFSPFLTSDFVVKFYTNPEDTIPAKVMTEGLDYQFVLSYHAATRSIGKPVYGGISISAIRFSGTVGISYRTIGGEWIANKNYVLQVLAEKAYNPRIAYWDEVTNVQQMFPPVNHPMDFDKVYGQQELIQAIDRLRNDIAANRNADPIVRHLLNQGPLQHLTEEMLAKINSIQAGIATAEEVDAGTEPNKAVNPVQLKRVLDVIRTTLDNHIKDYNNPHRTPTGGGTGIENLPVASMAEVYNQSPVSKLVTLHQVLNLINEYPLIDNTTNIGFSSNTAVSNGALTATFTTTDGDDCTLYWTIEHSDTTDANFINLNGQFQFVNGTGQFVINVSNVILTADKTFYVAIRTGSVTGPITEISTALTLKA